MPSPLLDSYPCLTDRTAHTPFDAHYFYQAAWMARRLAVEPPERHVDVGSHTPMLAVLTAFVKVLFVDYRPLKVDLSGMQCQKGDLLNLDMATNSVPSLSSLHVIEHVGLGRYGDPLDLDGSEKAAKELSRILAPGGRLFLSVPMGRERVCFNAHRVFSFNTFRKIFADLELVEFSYIDDKGLFHEKTTPDSIANDEYGCGLFLFRK